MNQTIESTYLRLLKYKMIFRVNPQRNRIDYDRDHDGVWHVFFNRGSKYCKDSERFLMDCWILPKDTDDTH